MWWIVSHKKNNKSNQYTVGFKWLLIIINICGNVSWLCAANRLQLWILHNVILSLETHAVLALHPAALGLQREFVTRTRGPFHQVSAFHWIAANEAFPLLVRGWTERIKLELNWSRISCLVKDDYERVGPPAKQFSLPIFQCTSEEGACVTVQHSLLTFCLLLRRGKHNNLLYTDISVSNVLWIWMYLQCLKAFGLHFRPGVRFFCIYCQHQSSWR